MTGHLWLDLAVAMAQILLLLAQTFTQWHVLRAQVRRDRSPRPTETEQDN
ncbi:hypothetical protein ACWCQK_32140 [Streptomyces sp. NPDC002306]